MAEHSRYLYVPTSSAASRMAIEQSSYSTTPALSTGDNTPLSGQATYKLKSPCKEEIDTLHKALELCANEVKEMMPVNMQNDCLECPAPSCPCSQGPPTVATETVQSAKPPTSTTTSTITNITTTNEPENKPTKKKRHFGEPAK
jgi:hypothetical protein